MWITMLIDPQFVYPIAPSKRVFVVHLEFDSWSCQILILLRSSAIETHPFPGCLRPVASHQQTHWRRPGGPALAGCRAKRIPNSRPLCLLRLHISIHCRKKVPRAPHTADLVSRKRSSGIAFCQYRCGMKNFKRQNWGEEQKYSDTKKAIQTVPTWKNDRYFRPFLRSSGQKALYVPQLRIEREREREIYII